MSQEISADKMPPEVTVRDVLVFLRQRFWWAAVGGGIGLVAAVILVLILTPEYTADTIVLPESPSALGGQSSGLASKLSGLGGLASLAGISLNGMSSFKADAVATLGSRVLTNEYISQNDLLPILYPHEWNPVTKAWRAKRGGPTLWRADRRFKRHIRVIKTDQQTGLVTMTITWKNAQVAAEWANGLVRMTNDYMRRQAIDEAERNISYLNSEVNKTNVVTVRNEIYALMEEEIRSEMVAKGERQFALKVIDPALPPDKPSFPRPVIWIPMGAIGGVFLGYLLCLARELSKEPNYGRQSPQTGK